MNTKIKVLVLSGETFVSRRIFAALRDSDWAAPVYGHAPSELHELLDQVDAVVNCTGSPGFQMVAVARGIEAYVQKRQIKVVQLSSISAYGHVAGKVDEINPLVEGLDDYSDGKAKSDAIISRVKNAVVFREGIVYGPGSEYWGGLIGRLLISGRLGNLGANGEGICNLIYIDDLVQIVTDALVSKNTDAQIFNLVAPNPPTWNDFFAKYAQMLGCKKLNTISGISLFLETRVFSLFLVILSKILSKIHIGNSILPDPLRASLIDTCRQKITVDASKIDAVYQVEWQGLDQGVQKMALWFKEQTGH